MNGRTESSSPLLEPVDLAGIYRLDPLNELLREAGQPEVSGEAA